MRRVRGIYPKNEGAWHHLFGSMREDPSPREIGGTAGQDEGRGRAFRIAPGPAVKALRGLRTSLYVDLE